MTVDTPVSFCELRLIVVHILLVDFGVGGEEDGGAHWALM